MQRLRWMRALGDVIYATGSLAFVCFLIGLLTGHSYEMPEPRTTPAADPLNDTVTAS
jgi:hypothetical protein